MSRRPVPDLGRRLSKDCPRDPRRGRGRSCGAGRAGTHAAAGRGRSRPRTSPRAWYVRSIARAAAAVGITCTVVDLGPGSDADRTSAPSCAALERRPDGARDHPADPAAVRGADFEALASAIDPAKDVDGANPQSLGRLAAGLPAFAPATAEAVLALLDHHDVPLSGRHAVVVGRSTVVGKPAATCCSTATRRSRCATGTPRTWPSTPGAPTCWSSPSAGRA